MQQIYTKNILKIQECLKLFLSEGEIIALCLAVFVWGLVGARQCAIMRGGFYFKCGGKKN